MLIKTPNNLFAALICILILHGPAAGFVTVDGTVSGFVRDSQSQIPLPNASVLIEGTSLGASADKYGFYVIHNVPLGTYVVKAQMIGYATTKIQEVVVKTDQDSKVDFDLASQVLCIEPEIVITAPRNNLPQEQMNSMQHVGGQDLTNNTPIGTFQDAVDLLPGVVNNHFRGGRSSEVLYMIDGFPVSGAMTRELAFLVPNSSIAEMVVQTGGFNAEYGNASGVVNVVTKEGRSEFKGIAKISTNTIGWRKLSNDNFQEAEFAIGGPFAASFGGPVVDGSYFLSSNVQATDTPYRNELRQFFQHPVKYNYNINSKLALQLSTKIQLRVQLLASRWNWHEYDAAWDERLSALPERDNRSLRFSASLTHTVTPKMFYTLSAAALRLQNSVRGQTPDGTISPTLYMEGKSPARVWPGATEPWRERLHEESINLRFNLVRQLHAAHQFSVGVESQIYDMSFSRDRYLSWPLPAQTSGPGVDYVYTRYQDNIRAFPFAISAFAQNRFRSNLLTVNIGIRYDIYNLTNGGASQSADSILLRRSTSEPGVSKKALSPRINLAFLLSDRSRVSMNYGWFYQMPPLFYAFTNGSARLDSYWPMLGDEGLKPSRSVAYEASYSYILARDVLFNVTSFWRNTDNLVDVIPAAFEGGETARGYARYANIASASSNGVELQLQKSYGEGLSGFLNYTYLRAKGTASSAESGVENLIEGDFRVRQMQVPLQWDQNHTLALSLNYARRALNLNLLNRVDGPLKAFESPLVSRQRLPWRYHLDFKLSYSFKSSVGSIAPFIEARNLFDRRYPTVPDEGILFNRANTPWQDRFGRSFRIGMTLQ